ncbi:MAG: ABC transporter permease [Chloroflexi bacterium]|nr:ABC transporter permease [Chloroflexota bacterium]
MAAVAKRRIQVHTEDQRSFVLDTFRLLGKSPLTLTGLLIVLGLFGLALLADLIATQPRYGINPAHRFLPPSTSHLMGTDEYGRDIFSRVVHGTRISLGFGFLALAIVCITGFSLGFLSGYIGGFVDTVIMRAADVFLGFPHLVLAVVVSATLGSGLTNVMIAMGFVWWPFYARMARAAVISTKEEEFVEAARAIGAKPFRILVKHVIPNCIGPLIVQVSLDVGRVILYMAMLGYLGVGAQPPTPEWGLMVREGTPYVMNQWWISTFPSFMILMATMGYNLLGDGIRDIFDPRMRRVR